jgi:hypothetical protein
MVFKLALAGFKTRLQGFSKDLGFLNWQKGTNLKVSFVMKEL